MWMGGAEDSALDQTRSIVADDRNFYETAPFFFIDFGCERNGYDHQKKSSCTCAASAVSHSAHAMSHWRRGCRHADAGSCLVLSLLAITGLTCEALSGGCSSEFAGEAGSTLEDFVTVPPVLVLSYDSVPLGGLHQFREPSGLLGELPATVGLRCPRARTPIGILRRAKEMCSLV